MIALSDVRAVVVFSADPPRLASWYAKQFACTRGASQPGFVALHCGGVSLFVQRTSEGHAPGLGGIRPHFTVADCAEAYRALLQAGATSVLPVTDVGEELVAAVADPEGNPLGLLAPKAARRGRRP